MDLPQAPHDPLDEARAFAKVWGGLFGGGREAPRVDQYYLLEEIGAGAMGVVYTAYDRDLQRHVALKLLRRDELDGKARARLLQEARAMARVDHPNVVRVYGVGESPHGGYVAMEFVEGENLAQWLERKEHSWRDIVACFVLAGRGLVAAHEAGIVHRDFKPTNVLVGTDRIVRVADFGLAARGRVQLASTSDGSRRATGERDADTDGRLTATGATLGTPAYMAPEQARGDEVSPAADQYAFCVSLHEALFGVLPGSPPTKSRAVPRAIHVLIAKGLEDAPDDRHMSMRALVDGLQRVHDPRPRRRTALAALAGVAVLSAFAAFGLRATATESTVDDPCTNLDSELEEISTSGRPSVEDPWTKAALDQYATRWLDIRGESCVEHRDGRESDTLFDLRMECLARGRSALIEAHSIAGQELLDPTKAEALVAGLPSLERCENNSGLMTAVARPDDPKQRAEGEELLALVQREFLRIDAGLPPSAGAVSRIRARADTSSDPMARGDARRLLAALERDPLLQHALRVKVVEDAIACHGLHLMTLGYLELGETQGGLGRFDAMADNLDFAEAANTRLRSSDPGAAASVAAFEGGIETARASMSRQRGDPEAALEHAQAAVRAWELSATERPLRLSVAVNNVGEALRLLGRPRQAIEYYDRALELAGGRLGEDELSVALIYNNRGAARLEGGQLVGALEDLEHAARVLDANDAPDAGLAHFNLAEATLLSERYDESRTHFQRAQERFSSAGGVAQNVLASFAEAGLASVALESRSREFSAILGALAESESEIAAVTGPAHPYLVTILELRARTLLAMGDFDAARRSATTGLDMLDALGTHEGTTRATVLTTLGKIEAAAGRPSHAIDAFVSSVELLDRQSPHHPCLADPLSRLAVLQRDPALARRAGSIADRHSLGPALRLQIEGALDAG